MPSRKRSANTCDVASRSPKDTGLASLAVCSDMFARLNATDRYFILIVVLFLILRQPLASGRSIAQQAVSCKAQSERSFRHSCRWCGGIREQTTDGREQMRDEACRC